MTTLATCSDERREAIVALNRLLAQHPENPETALVDATAAVVRLRDRLIAMSRKGTLEHDARAQLRNTNAVLSVLMAGHYPIEGMRWDCIKQARDALSATPGVPPTVGT